MESKYIAMYDYLGFENVVVRRDRKIHMAILYTTGNDGSDIQLFVRGLQLSVKTMQKSCIF
jgi:hypothetical protein